MATCSRCKKSGLTLKLDIRDLCPSCQAEKNYAIEQDLKKLQSFYDQFKCIPNAKAEAEQIVSEAQKQAHLFHEEIVQEKEALQSENDRINNLQEFYDKWKIVPDADFEARTILAEAHNQAAVIIAEAEAYKQKTLMEIEQAHEKLNKKNEEVRLNTTAAIANAQAHIAALLASASRDFSSMAKERAANELEYQPLKFQ